jgi:GTP-dependent phosphoenolpyruvate carboxykinase
MKKELITKKQNLEKELLQINSQINLEILREDLEELQQITDQLNSLFQNKIVEKYGDNYWRGSSENASNLLYDAMQILDKASVQLEEEISDIDLELNSETETENNN